MFEPSYNHCDFNVMELKKERFDLLFPIEMMRIFWFDGILLAGGSLQTVVNRSIKINDFDLFFTKSESKDAAVEILESAKYKKVYECSDLITYRRSGLPKIQIITKQYYLDAAHLIDSFDITASMWAYDGKQLITTKQAIRDTRNKIVNLHKVTYPVATMNRISKYKHVKGFFVPQKTYIDFLARVGVVTNKYNMQLYVD